MAARERLICASSELEDSGKGVRFEPVEGGEGAFAIRYEGRVYAYMNRCAHIPVEMDWQPGRFFDAEGLLLICSIHGAVYQPDTGKCLGGPCFDGKLIPVPVVERDGNVYFIEG